MKATPKDVARFASKVNFSGPGGCWVFGWSPTSRTKSTAQAPNLTLRQASAASHTGSKTGCGTRGLVTTGRDIRARFALKKRLKLR